MNMLEMDALAQAEALQSKRFSAAELMQATLARIDAVNGDINAIVALRDGETLMQEAREADASVRRGWLHGIPIAIKDLADVAGMVTSQGSPLFADEVAAADDIMVARLRAAGAIIIGKTNVPEFGLGSHTYNPVYGATRNPYDPSRSAGGSSGGAAAALAARLVSVADGSDMMGSLRNPAGWNNVYGMRPTWGAVPSEPRADMFLHQLSTLGPMARSPADMAAMLDTIGGIDARQPHTQALPPTLPAIGAPLPPQRIGWLGDWDGAFPYEPGIAALCETALNGFSDLGHDTDTLAAPFGAEAIWESWITLRSFAIAAARADDHADPARRSALKPQALWEIERGLAMDAMTVHRASVIRSDWFRAAARLFDEIDVLALPSTQIWPFDVTQDHPTQIAGVAMDTYHRWMQVVVPASLIGLPVVNVPAGFGKNGLPGGLQLIGPRGSDARLLQLAQAWHQATGWPQKRPPVIAASG